MLLINTETLALESFFGGKIPEYAILSHTWGDEEVTFQAWQDGSYRDPLSASKYAQGRQKIERACSQTRKMSLRYLWVDTNCINKESSAELSEAINSMFAWYRRSAICFVYLDDLGQEESHLEKLEKCRWFTRGWTLQELLAPSEIHFFNADWVQFGTKASLGGRLSNITSIDEKYLDEPDSVRQASISQRMSWVAKRLTTRAEDVAYCLLGIFDVNMPMLYGEGDRAFIRLQEEIIRHNNDHTIFCWYWPPEWEATSRSWTGCLAPHPMAFRDSGNFRSVGKMLESNLSDFQLTNVGLRITLPIWSTFSGGPGLAMLNAQDGNDESTRLCVWVRKSDNGEGSRLSNPIFAVPAEWASPHRATAKYAVVFLAHQRDTSLLTFTGRSIIIHKAPAQEPCSYALILCSVPRAWTIWVKGVPSEDEENENYGPLVVLRHDGESRFWSQTIKVEGSITPIYGRSDSCDITFKVEMDPSPRASWRVEATMSWSGFSGTATDILWQEMNLMDLPKASERTIETPSGPRTVQPILLNFTQGLFDPLFGAP